MRVAVAMEGGSVKITSIESVRLTEHPAVCFVQVHTDEGLVGLGETFVAAETVEAYLHEIVAPKILGVDALAVEAIARSLVPYVGGLGAGAEVRAASAIDIALWDIAGQAAGLPLYRLWGGPFRREIPIYNSCAGYRYGRAPGYHTGVGDEPAGPYEDLDAFMNRPEELANSLLEEGYDTVKIWPFDAFAVATGGTSISAADLQAAIEPVRRMRESTGGALEVLVELHGLWNVPTACRIAAALEDLAPGWLEEPVRPDDPAKVAAVAASTCIPIASSETLVGRSAFRQLMEAKAVDVVILDVSWCGGLSEARKIAALADSYGLPLAPHDCSGPVVLAASVHLGASIPNILVQEMSRALYHGWYGDVVTDLPVIVANRIQPLEAPGLGMALQPDLLGRDGVMVRRSSL